MLLREFDDNSYESLRDIQYENDMVAIKKITSYIEFSCSNILELYRSYGKYFYRGINIYVDGSIHLDYKNSDIFFGKPPINRRPVDTPIWIQAQLDVQLKGAGFKALRSNSIFCIGDRTFAEGYGEPYMIFPVNGFDYSWCSSAVDLFKEFIEANFKCGWEELASQKEKQEADQFREDLYKMSSQEFVKYYGFKNTDLSHSLIQTHEVLIHGDYVAISGRLGEEIVNGDKK